MTIIFAPIRDFFTGSEAVLEDLVLTVRAELEQVSDLGFQAAEAIHEVLKGRTIEPLPAVRTIHPPL